MSDIRLPPGIDAVVEEVEALAGGDISERHFYAGAVAVGYYIPTRNLPRSAVLAVLVVAVFHARSHNVTIEDPEQVDVDQRVRAMRRLEQAIAPEDADE